MFLNDPANREANNSKQNEAKHNLCGRGNNVICRSVHVLWEFYLIAQMMPTEKKRL